VELKTFKEKVIKCWMLEGVVDGDDITILPRQDDMYTTSMIFERMKEELIELQAVDAEKADRIASRTGFRCITGGLRYDEEAEEKALLQVGIKPGAANNINQYEFFVNLLLADDARGVKFERGRLVIYVPEAVAVDLEKMLQRYEKYVSEVMKKA